MKYWKDGFYDGSANRAIPEGAVRVTDEQWRALLDGQSEGKEIRDVDGVPTLAERTVTTTELESRARAKRDERLSAVEWRVSRHDTQVRLGVTPTEADITPVLEYMQKLRDLPTQEGWPEKVEWPEIPEE